MLKKESTFLCKAICAYILCEILFRYYILKINTQF